MDTQSRTIADFGKQWTMLTENTGYYASVGMLRDILDPLVDVATLKDKSVCEIGAGTGRIVNMLLDCGVAHVTALEPSEAFAVLRENVGSANERVTSLQLRGDELDHRDQFDFVCSIGVIHHIPEPAETLRKMYQSVKPGGSAFIWVYGREGNELYLFFSEKLRAITKRLPDAIVKSVAHFLSTLLLLYISLCRILPLPMKKYMLNVVGKYTYYNLFLTVFDQLNPAHAVYYRKSEAIDLLRDAGFSDIEIFHRHGYSWSVLGRKTDS